MLRPSLGSAIRAVTISLFLCAALPAQAANPAPVRWHIVGIISGLANPFTTAAYFPRPLVAGELVDMTVTVNTSATAGFAFNGYASYPGAIVSALVSGSDWSIPMRAPLAQGEIAVTDDHPDYGDTLFLNATTAARPGKTWFSINLNFSNPGGPSPGVGPWQPFTSLALPKTAPALGSFPNAYFYIQARRDVAGQEMDGASYWGQILSIEQVRCH